MNYLTYHSQVVFIWKNAGVILFAENFSYGILHLPVDINVNVNNKKTPLCLYVIFHTLLMPLSPYPAAVSSIVIEDVA